MYQAELRAIGEDGSTDYDDESQGGGNYRNVQRAAEFLRGYRKAEARKISRANVKILLKVVGERGVDGLDEALSSMGPMGALNDDLLIYLAEVIEEKERESESTGMKIGKTGPEATAGSSGAGTETVAEAGGSAGAEAPVTAGSGVSDLLKLLRILQNRIKVEGMLQSYKRGTKVDTGLSSSS